MESIDKIAVLFGGSSGEREVSLESGKRVYDAIITLGYDCDKFDINDIKDINVLRNFDFIFIALHGEEGESGALQKQLETIGIPFTGSNSESCSYSWNKSISKDLIRKNGIKTPDSIQINNPLNFNRSFKDIPFDHFFIKPSMDGSSVNIFEIKDENEYLKTLQQLSSLNGPFILEEAIKHKEYTVTIIGDLVFPPIEIKTANSFYDYEAKYLSDDTDLVEAQYSNEWIDKIKHFARDSYEALKCSGWARVDILEDKYGDLYFLELNSSPGMTSHSCVPKSGEFIGLSYNQVVQKIINASID